MRRNQASSAQSTPRIKLKSDLAKRVWKHRSIYMLILPAVIWFLIFCYYPMYGLLIAFKDYKYSKGILGSNWVGLLWFERFLTDPSFWSVVTNTLRISIMKLACCFPLPIIMALMINAVRNVRFKRLVQTISYMPHFVSWVVVAAMLHKLLSPYSGVVNEIRLLLDPSAEAIFYMGRKDMFYPMVVLSEIWKESGWGTIIYLAALAGIDPSLYEAGSIDGARPMQMTRYITLPCIYPTICIMLIMNLGNILNVGYEQLLLLQTTPTAEIAEIIDTYVIRRGLRNGNHSYSTAIGLLKSLITLALVSSVNTISRKTSGVSLW